MAARRRDRDGRPDENGRTLLDRIAFLIELSNYPLQKRADIIARRGLKIEQIKSWRLEAKRRLRHLPPPSGRKAT